MIGEEIQNSTEHFFYGCFIAWQVYPLYEPYQTSMLVSIPADILLAFLIIPANLMVIIVILKTRSLQTLTNLCLASTAVCDLCVALLNIPLFNANFLLAVQRRYNCGLYVAMYFITHYVFNVSFFMAFMMMADRYCAILHPFRYQRFQTRYYVLIIVFIWLFIFGIMSIAIFKPFLMLLMLVESFCFTGCLILIAVVHWRIRNVINKKNLKIHFLTPATQRVAPDRVRRKNNQIVPSMSDIEHNTNSFTSTLQEKLTVKNFQIQTAEQRQNKQNLQKQILLFLMVFANALCYIPFVICALTWTFYRDTDWVQTLNMWAFFSASCKSLINPLLYFYALKQMRTALKQLVGLSESKRTRTKGMKIQIQQGGR